MKIGELPINSTVQIRVSQGEMRYECNAIVVATRDDGLFLTPIKHKGQMIDFASDKVQILAFYVDENRRAIGWSGCRIRKDTYQNKLCHVLTTKRDSVRVNRRGELRIRTDMNAVLRTISSDEEKEIVIRNYSENGMAFVSATNIHERDFLGATVVYEDAPQQFRVVMRLHILRKTENSNGTYFYGARIYQPDESWIKYVAVKTDELKQRNADRPGVSTNE